MVSEIKSWWNRACWYCQWVRLVARTCVYLFVSVLSLYGTYQLYDWWHDGSPTVEFSGGTIEPQAVRPGERVLVQLNVHKLRNCDGEIRRVVFGQCGHHLVSTAKSTLLKSFKGQLTLSVQIPMEAIPGDCGFKVYARYWCNPFDLILNRQFFESPPIPFRVKGWTEK